MKNVMCSTCGMEGDFGSKDAADAAHMKYDPAHEPYWYEDGDIDKPVW